VFLDVSVQGNYPRRKLVVRSSGENEEKRGIGHVVNVNIFIEQSLFTPSRARKEMIITGMPFSAGSFV
jgi:hypothetical protein